MFMKDSFFGIQSSNTENSVIQLAVGWTLAMHWKNQILTFGYYAFKNQILTFLTSISGPISTYVMIITALNLDKHVPV